MSPGVIDEGKINKRHTKKRTTQTTEGVYQEAKCLLPPSGKQVATRWGANESRIKRRGYYCWTPGKKEKIRRQ
jgi:hypothetical protein